MIRPVVKCHGGKYYLRDWVISHFPDGYTRMTYLEPFIGGGSVLLNKPRSGKEIVSEASYELIAIYRAIQTEPVRFQAQLQKLTYSQKTFDAALAHKYPTAVNEYVLRRMSRGGMKTAFAWSERLRNGLPGDVNAWNTAVASIPAVSERLQGVAIRCGRAVVELAIFNSPTTFTYVDPPYLHATRTAKDAYGAYEMTETAHETLAESLLSFRGKVLLSGYDSDLYRRLYAGWNCVRLTVANHSGQGQTKQTRTECLWRNY